MAPLWQSKALAPAGLPQVLHNHSLIGCSAMVILPIVGMKKLRPRSQPSCPRPLGKARNIPHPVLPTAKPGLPESLSWGPGRSHSRSCVH